MREIKFRAWDYDSLQMYDDEQIIIQSGTVFIGKIKYIHKISDDVELMQFTGLKDRNGVEIYEGDIIKEPCYHCKDNVNIAEVVFEDCVIKLKGDSCDSFASHSAKYGEVIGNIYENKELLNEEN